MTFYLRATLVCAIQAIAILSLAGPVRAAEQFSCEMIKDKPTRARCIKARDVKAAEEGKAAVERERLTAEKERAEKEAAELEAIEAERRAEKEKQMTFVEGSKKKITVRLKDPDSAKFDSLRILTHMQTGKRTLCGTVNAKNSYGGYVGSKGFHVTEEAVSQPIYMLGDGSNSKDFDTLMAALKASKEYEALCLKPDGTHESQEIN